MESSLPLLLGAKRKTAFCRYLGGGHPQVMFRQALPSALPTPGPAEGTPNDDL